MQTLEDINRADTSTGYPALGYLLNAYESDADIVASFLEEERRCEYLQSLTELNLDVAQRFENAWFEQGGNYAAELTKAGLGSSVFGSEQDAIAVMLRGMTELTAKMATIKLEQPLMLENSEALEAAYSENSLLDLTYNIEAVEDLYMGSSLSLSDYFVGHGGAELDLRIQEAIRTAQVEIEAIPAPLHEAIYTAPDQVERASIALDSLASLLRNDVEEFASQIQ